MNTTQYTIDGKIHEIKLGGSSEFLYGKDEVLSDKERDITYCQDWYPLGYKTANFLNEKEFAYLKTGLTQCISNIMSKYIPNLSGFKLDKYHKFVSTNELHYQIVSVTRDLYPEDFNFPLNDMIKKFGDILGFELTDIDPRTGKQLHIILRINRPGSTDFNPPHKDIHGAIDKGLEIPRFVNLWIPVCGVTHKSSLPLAISSHLLPESKILRTIEGGVVEGKKYRVRSIIEWDKSNVMTRPPIKYGEVLLFSPNLIHGLAINGEENITRISLEFRLFKKSNK